MKLLCPLSLVWASLAFLGVSKAQTNPTTVTLSTSSNPSYFGQSLRLTAVVSPTAATGHVTFLDGPMQLGSSPLVNGSGSLNTVNVVFGTRNLTARYSGDSGNSPSTSQNVSQNVIAKAGGAFEQLAILSYTNHLNFPVSADLNGDGKPDIIGSDSKNINVWLGNGDGTFKGPLVTPGSAGQYSIEQIGIADFNQDGRQDLAVADPNGSINVLLGNGDGTFQPYTSYPAAYGEDFLCIGDFNGDGFLDIIGTDQSSGLHLFLGNGDGTFQTSLALPSISNSPPATGDFNGDGKLDLAIPIPSGVCVMMGNGDGSFQPCVNYSSPGSVYLVVGDVNRDGVQDIVVSNASPQGISVLLGNSDGTFRPPVTIPLGYTPNGGNSIQYGIALADFNADGIPDVLYPTEFENSIFFGVGNGNFLVGPSFSTGAIGSIALGDFNLDGITDAVSGSSFGTVSLGQYAPPVLLTASSTVVTLGQGVVLNAAIQAPSASGSITFHDGYPIIGSASLVSGSALFPIAQPSLGSHEYWAAYSGNLPTSSSGSVGVQVQQQTSTTLTANPISSTVGQTVTLTATVSPVAEGFVTFFASSAVLGNVGLVGGSASFHATLLPSGPQVVSGLFTDTSGYLSSSASINIFVNAIGGGTFSSGELYLLNATPSYLVSGDLNQDQKLDIAITEPALKEVVAFFGKGDGTFQAPHVSVFQFTPGALALDELTSLGYPGLIVADPTDNLIWLTSCDPQNFGTSFCSPVQSYNTGVNPSAITLADFNRDGGGDLAVANAGSNSVSVFLRACLVSCTFYSNSDSFPVGTDPESLVAGDLNGDGIPDLITANRGSATLSVLIGKGDGTFLPAVNYAVGASPIAIAIADFNGDGKLDIASANSGSSSVSILLGNGDGTLRAGSPLNVSATVSSLATGDFNGDGRADLAVGDASGVAVFYGNGDGTFGAAANFSSNFAPGMIVAGDFSGSGRVDLAEILPGGNEASVILNEQASSIGVTLSSSASTYGVPVGITAILTPAITSGKVTFYDGVAVIGTVSGTSGKAFLSTSQLAPGLHSITARFLGGSGLTKSVSAPALIQVAAEPTNGFKQTLTSQFPQGLSLMLLTDFNNDGYADYAVEEDGGLIVVALGDGAGTFRVLSPALAHLNGAVVSDFNADGKPDLAEVDGPFVNLQLGNGDGTFAAASTVYIGESGAQFTGPIATADFNQDGIPDLIVADTVNGELYVFLGVGDGTFQVPRIFSTGTQQTSLAVADFNRDGIPDVVVTTGNPGSAALVLLGKGDGNFQTGYPVATGSGASMAAVGDFNADGVPDLAVVSPTGGVTTLLGNGEGTFRTSGSFQAGSSPSSVALGDINGDGKSDLVVADRASSNIAIFLGNGDGTFQAASPIALPTNPYAVAVSDFNGNSTSDLMVIATTVDSLGDLFFIAGEPAFAILHGSPQSVPVGAQYSVALAVNAPAGNEVVFKAPASGASGSFAGGLSITVTSSANGVATAPAFTANGISGAFQVIATMGTDSVAFSLNNTCSLSASPGSINSDSNGLSTSISLIASAAGCGWAITSSVPWIALSQTSGSGTLSVSVTLSPNTSGVDQNGQISVNGIVIPVVERGTVQVFSDVPPTAYYFDAVDLLAAKGITHGCAPNDYCPIDSVTRADMAIFIVRAIYGSDSFPYSQTAHFNDVAPTDFGFAWIQAMFELGITTGCGDGDFCPDEAVTRAQMAIFIIRARFGSTTVFDTPSTPYFTDVAPGAFGYTWIQRLAFDGITSGCGTGKFCPNNPVSRGDMSIFVMKGLFNALYPAATPEIISVSPSQIPIGQSTIVTVTGVNTNFGNGTVLNPIPGLTLGSPFVQSPYIVLFSATPLVTDIATQPFSIFITSTAANQEVVLPNQLTLVAQ